MEIVKNALVLILFGVKDCAFGIFQLYYVLSFKQSKCTVRVPQQSSALTKSDLKFWEQDSNSSVFGILFQCIVFNVLLGLSNFAFNTYVTGLLFDWFVAFMGEDLDSLLWLKKLLYCFFCLSWIFPILILSKFLNFFWYKDIADLTQEHVGVRGRPQIHMRDYYADQIQSLVLQIFYYLQSYAAFLLPLPSIIQYAWYLFHASLLSSLYAFEYKWLYIGWHYHRRMLTINRKWPYFLGFGLPLAVMSSVVDSIVNSMIIFNTLFPFYVISSTVTYDPQSPMFSFPINSFKVVDSFTESIVSFCLRRIGIRNLSR